MHMTKRPVLVPVITQLLDGTRGIMIVTVAAIDGAVQKANIEAIQVGSGILARDVLGHTAIGETLPMDGDRNVM